MTALNTNSFFRCFAPTQSKIDGVVGKPCFSNPFRYSLFFAKRFNKTCVSSVLGLLRSIRPHAVFGAVPLVVINSFNAKPVWTLSHIRQEILKVHPSGANSYSPAAIILVRFASRASASFFKPLPYLVSRSAFSTQSVSM
jgi:hypothetical protein